jgi:hypothetical protein
MTSCGTMNVFSSLRSGGRRRKAEGHTPEAIFACRNLPIPYEASERFDEDAENGPAYHNAGTPKKRFQVSGFSPRARCTRLRAFRHTRDTTRHARRSREETIRVCSEARAVCETTVLGLEARLDPLGR